MKYKIEKGFEIPEATQGRNTKYPFREMKVGDSFLYSEDYSRENMTKLSNAARNFANKAKDIDGWRFEVRKVEDNKLRVWRVK